MTKLLKALLLTLLIAAPLAAQSISGTVTNRTNNRVSPNDDVVLLKLAQGMQELARTKSDAKGHFTIQIPESGLHLLRVTHDKANYFQPVQPGQSQVAIDVYSSAPEVEGVTLDADVMRIQTDASGSALRVTEHFFIKNDSAPPTTLMSEHPFELYLPAGATVEGAAAKAPGGMAVQSGLVPEGEANKFAVIFPLRPGETEFQVTYKLPYDPKAGYTFQPRPVRATDNLVVMLPKAITFKAGQGTPYVAVTEEVGAQTYVARSIQPSQPVSFTLTGQGELPRDTAPNAGTGSSADPNAGPSNTAATGDPNTDPRPGGGLGVPLDKDAERAPLTKYKWWIIAGLASLLAVGAGIFLRQPTLAQTLGGHVVLAPIPVSGGPGALNALRDEMFALETDRHANRITQAEYEDLKIAYDKVLRRTMQRQDEAVDTAVIKLAEDPDPKA